MAEDNQMLKVIPKVQPIRITSRRDTPRQRQGQGEPEENERDLHDEQELHEHHEETMQQAPHWWHYRIELGRLLMEQKNLELSLFTSLQEENQLESEKRDLRERENRLRRIKGRISELEQKIASLDYEEAHRAEHGEHLAIDRQLQGLRELRGIYREYGRLTMQESDAIMHGDLTTLHQLMAAKKSHLERIHILQNLLDLHLFEDRAEEDAKRAKANRILTDIHSEMTRILDTENQNSVELRNQKEEVRAELGKRNAGAKAVSRYASAPRHSRFVDTTK